MLLVTENRIWLDHDHYLTRQFCASCITPIKLLASEKIPKDKSEFKLGFQIMEVQMRSTR